MRPPGRHRDERVLRDNARPAGRQRGQVSVAITVEDPVLAPVVSVDDEVDSLPVERMERVRDPDGPRRLSGARRS